LNEPNKLKCIIYRKKNDLLYIFDKILSISPIKKHNDAGFKDKTYDKTRYLDNNVNKE